MWMVLFTLLIIVSVLLTLFILMQEKGVGLSLTFGGQGNVYSSNRGAKKLLNYATTACAIAFLILSFIFVLASPRSFDVPTDLPTDIPTPEDSVPLEFDAGALEDGRLDISDFEVKEVGEGKVELTPKTE